LNLPKGKNKYIENKYIKTKQVLRGAAHGRGGGYMSYEDMSYEEEGTCHMRTCHMRRRVHVIRGAAHGGGEDLSDSQKLRSHKCLYSLKVGFKGI